MKKILALVLVIAMCFGFAAAEIDLSGMTFNELLELQQQVMDALWQMDESWAHVTLESGRYIVGEDLPAGRYRLTAVEGGMAVYAVGKFEESEEGLTDRWIDSDLLADPTCPGYIENMPVEVFVELEDGCFLELYGTAIVEKVFAE